MSQVRLGKLHLHWCKDCNVPIVEEGSCGNCGQEAEKVKITPPGDVRPAFEYDIELIRETIDRQWGSGFSHNLIKKDKIALLNNAPGLDRMDEVIVDGDVIGNLRYNVLRKAKGREPYDFILRPWDDIPVPEHNYVIVDEGAVDPISEGGSVLSPGVIEADQNIKKHDEVLVFDEDKSILASGPAVMDGDEMIESGHGKAVKNRWRISDHTEKEPSPGWDEIIEANKDLIEERVGRAERFIRSQIERNDLPPAVAYSGGKDSLATLHLLLDAGIDPDLMFIDTGIELPETIENVKMISEKYDLNTNIKKAKSGYWNNVDFFGPSARDYRWCCKTCKLGPTASLIDENYTDGVLSFIGQRKYESQQRQDKGSSWNNPWVPGQKAVSPIQDWTAFHVWLYLFKKDAEYNSLYEKGFERIGCWVCPASDLAELDTIRKNHEYFSKFEDTLERYRERNDRPKIWKELGMWRWIDVPEEMERIMKEIGEETLPAEGHEDYSEKRDIDLKEMLSLPRTRNLLKIRGDEEIKGLLDLYPNDLDRLDDEQRIKMKDKVYEFFLKADRCVRCGICIARCPEDALRYDDGIKVDPEKCISCMECLGKCPVVEFDSRSKSNP